MNAYEIAERFDLSLSKSKKIAKALSLPVTTKDARIAAIRLHLSRGCQLSTKQLLLLIKEPALRPKLGKYDSLVYPQMYALGNVPASTAPIQVTAYIAGAASGDPESVKIIVDWLKQILPSAPVRYQWIAVRLLIGQWPMLGHADFRRINLVMKNVRNHPEFFYWWDFEPIGTGWSTVYRRPRFDL